MRQGKASFAEVLLPTGWSSDIEIAWDGEGIITSVSPATSVVSGIAIPAIANVHSHAHQRLMAGLAEKAGPTADSFWTWRETMYRFANRLGPDDLQAVATQLYVEMLKAGFTAVGEFQYLHHHPDGRPYANRAELSLRCLEAAERAGIAITILPTLYRHGGFGAKPAGEGQKRFVNDADGFIEIMHGLDQACRGRGLRRLGISPHSLRAVDAPLLNSVTAELDGIDRSAPIHIHVAEQTKEVEDCIAYSGQRPVELLLDRFPVSARWCVIHATHMTNEESFALAESGAVAGLCPTTEANLGDGIFPARDFIDKGGAIAIGSDSHIAVSPAEDLRQLEYSQRLRDHARNVLAEGPRQSTGRSLYQAALKGGAQAIAQPVGAIAPGYRADLTVLDSDHSALIGRSGDAILDSWIFSGGNGCVKDVYVAGEAIITDRHHEREEEIVKDFRAAVKRLTQ